jgi:hypothetical protein
LGLSALFGFPDFPPMSNGIVMSQPMEDDLAVLRRLRDEGPFTTYDYEEPFEGYIDAPPDAGHPDQYTDTLADEVIAEDDETPAESPTPAGPSLRDDLDIRYLGILAAASIVLGVASWAGMLSWFVSIAVVMVLATTLFEGWQRVTLTSAVAVAALLIISVVNSEPTVAAESPPATQPVAVASEGTPTTQPSVAPVPAPDPDPPVTGSLDIHMDEVAGLWNAVDGPQITSGLTRQNEAGEYDAFIYRFEEWGRLLGAFDPDTEVIYALVASGQFSNEATDQLYVNLCYMVEQFSPDCLESYQGLGLGGAPLEDFAGTTHEAEWTLGANTWRLHIEGNVLTIRVFGADAA